jgi:hypothetical protein
VLVGYHLLRAIAPKAGLEVSYGEVGFERETIDDLGSGADR